MNIDTNTLIFIALAIMMILIVIVSSATALIHQKSTHLWIIPMKAIL